MANDPDVTIVRPGEGTRTGNVEFLALSEDTPRFNLSIITMAPGVEHTFENRTHEPVRVLNIHAPAGFDRRLLADD